MYVNSAHPVHTATANINKHPAFITMEEFNDDELMALDVHLKRVSNSTWEFRVIGKQGFNISVTEAQLPERRRQKVVAAVQEQAYSSTSSTSSDEESQPSQEVTSGLYDPVLDDTEVIYETIEPADSDQPSNQLDQPTEVFEVKQFTDQLDLTRSLTTSPFLVPPKPYRPFSTEPLEIPPLENPIILNPNYKDAFNSKEVEESLPETRFKLPISAQYDPDTKIKKEKTLSDNKITTITNKESIKDCKKEIKIESESTENTNEKVQKAAETINEEYKYLNKLKSEIDLEKIESTALAVVDESIQQAVTVAEEIKKEINSEIKQTDLREITSESNAHEESIHTSVKYQVEEEASKIQFNTKQSNKSEINVKETQQDIRQVTDELVQTTLEQKYDNSADIKAKTQFDTIESEKKSFKTDSKQESSSEKTEIFEAASEKKESGVTISSEKLLAEQRAYTIGLQTIPNIKGTIQSSYQYDLLLKTFFIHLTDVMVALSRFIITDPITTISKSDIEEKKKEINIKETKKNSVDKTIVEQKTQVHLAKKQSINKATDDKAHTENKQSVFETVTRIEADIVTNGENEAIKIQEKNINSSKNFDKEKVEKEFHHLHDSEENLTNEMEKYEIMVDEAELITKTKLSGAKIAQIEGRKSVELTDKMDKVITEFQRKSGTTEILDKEKLVDRKRSRSRSKVQEEILSVTNSSQLDSNKYVNVVESKFDRQHTSSKMGQYKSLENEKVETKDSGKITYVAIVEAHVYTNKQAIFEEQMRRMSEINTATQVEESSKMTSSSSECINYQNNVIKKQSLASSDIHKSARVVAEKVETFVQHQTGVVKVAKVKEQLNKEVVEDAKFVLAETMTTAVEEAKVDALQASKIKKAHARVDIESAVAHETVEVSLEESTHKELIIPDVTIKQSKPILQEGALGVAEVISTTIQEKDQELLVIKAKDEHAKVVINESAATLITEVLPLEPKDETLNIPEINKKQPHKKIHESILKVPETSIITIEECKGEIETAKVKVEKATVQVELSKVAETITTLCEEPEQKPPNVPNISTVQSKIIIEEPVLHTIEVHEVKVHDAKCEITDVSDTSKNIEEDISTQYTVELATDDHEKTYQEESAELKIIKHQIIEVTPPIEIYEDFQFDKKKLEIEQKEFQVVNTHEENIHLSHKATGLTKDNVVASEVQSSQTTYEQSACIKDQSSVHIQAMHSEKYTSENIQTLESNKSAKIKLDTQKSKELSLKSGAEGKLTLHTDVTNKTKANDENCPILTSTSVPPTPLVDEYVFKLEIPLPKSRGSTPIPRDCSVTPPSEHEDPNIVKKKLVPQIDTKIEQVVYDPPLPSPSTSPGTKSPPKYVKPGLRGGSDRPEITKDEIMEIERKSTLLTSAIDRTIRSIEEYKESVGIDMKQEIQVETKNDTSHTIIEESLDNNSEKSVSDGYNENTEKVNGYTEVKEENEYRDHLEGINKSSGSDEIEHHIEETIVLNGKKNGTTIEYRETTNESISNDQEEDNDEIFETVTINLSNSKRNSIEETNCTSVKIESDEEKEKQYEIIKHEYEDSTDVESVQFELVKNKFESQSENNDVSKAEEINVKVEDTPKEIVKKIDPLQGYRPVEFNPETYKQRKNPEILITDQVIWSSRTELYKTESGELIGSQQGIIDGLEEPVVDPEIAKELGKPGMPEEKIAELISGESEMLREAHVMGLTRVLTSHMHRILDDDCSVDFKKIKPLVDSLKDSEVLKALNEEILKNKAEKIKDERKWTTFLQKPVQKQKQKIVLSGNRDDVKSCNLESLYSHMEGDASEPYRVKIVKQPKPRIAPDYKPEDFDTGPLPWEERAVKEEKEAVEAPPVDPEDPILIPEDLPEFAEAVDPLPETEVPDLEDTGIPLPLSPILAYQELPTFVIEEKEKGEPIEETQQEELQVEEETDNLEEMDKNKITEQLLNNIENMVDPGATLEEQLSQMRVQLAALAQLPNVIQQTLALVTKQITQISQQKTVAVERMQTVQQVEEVQEQFMDAVTNIEESEVNRREETDAKNEEVYEEEERVKEVPMSDEEVAQIKREEQQRMIEEQQKLEKQKKELIEQMRIEQESRQVKQRSTPRVGKPRQIFGPPVPPERPVVLPGGRKWRKPEDAYNEQLIQETLTAQAEVIKGKAIGVNFMKYEKPPVSLDHLQRSEVYKAIHNMDEKPLKRVEMLTPVIAEADYRERKIKSRFSPINSVANRWPSRACSPNPQGEINDTMQ